MTQLFKNNAYSSLAAELSAVGTLASLATGHGARFPAPASGDHFLATLILLNDNGGETAWEIVKCTARATDGLTIERGQEGTTERLWPAGTRMELRTTAGTLDSFTDTTQAAAAAPVQRVAGKTGAVTLVKGDVGLGNVDNTSDANKPVSAAQQTALSGKESTGTAATAVAAHEHASDPHPQYLTQPEGDARYTSPAQVNTAIAALVGSAPGTLDTLNELATALGNDPNFATTVANQIGTKADAVATTAALATKAAAGTMGFLIDPASPSLEVPVVGKGSHFWAADASKALKVTDIGWTRDLFSVDNAGNVSAPGTATFTGVNVGVNPVWHVGNFDPATKQDAATAITIGNIASYAPKTVMYGLFYKVDSTSVAFTKTGAGTASIKAGTRVSVAETTVTFVADTAITMPALTVGTDYAIWVKDDATIQATANFTATPSAGNWRKIGGFHYAPGGNAVGQAGGNATPQINEYSFWDLKFRPACLAPRGMTLVADSFWADIYLLGVDHVTNGTSKYNVTIADGVSPPKVPLKFGGNGTNAYGSMNWWEANEVLKNHGKRSPTYDEFVALAYGTTEEISSGGTDVNATGFSGVGATSAWNVFTSKWGCIQSSGCMWVWGGNFGGGTATPGWVTNTGGRGSTYQLENAVLFGGYWGITSNAGSRATAWNFSPTASDSAIGARGVCAHLILD